MTAVHLAALPAMVAAGELTHVWRLLLRRLACSPPSQLPSLLLLLQARLCFIFSSITANF